MIYLFIILFIIYYINYRHHHHHHHLLSPCFTRVGIRIALRHSTRSCAHSFTRSLFFISLFTTPSHVCSGLPLPSFTSLSQPHTFLTSSSCSLLLTCPNHLSLLWANLSSMLSTPTLALTYSFLTVSLLVTPHIILNIFISATLSFCSWLFLIAQHSDEYIIAGLTTVQ